MGLWIRLAVLCVVLCVVVQISQAQKREKNILEVTKNAAKGRGHRVVSGRRPYGARLSKGFRRPSGLGRPLRRKSKGRFPQFRRKHQQQQQLPQVPQATQYGTVNLKPTSGLSGKFQYAQTAPVIKSVKLQHPRLKFPQRPVITKNQKPLSISMPTLANLLYKYASKSTKPFFATNPYSMFGPKAYGPMPKPSGYTRQHQTLQNSYQQRPVVQQPQQPQLVYRPAVQQQSVSYQKPVVQSQPTYQPAVTQATPPVYTPPRQQQQQQQQIYQPAPQPYQQAMPYQPPAQPARPSYQPVVPMQSFQQPSGYRPPSVIYQFSRPATQKSYMQAAPAAPACPAAGNFCYGKKAGHYTHPGSNACFIQCDAFGRGFAKGCSPGTFWKPVGPEPALWNMCS